MTKLKQLKTRCKELAALIRQDKAKYKDFQRGVLTYSQWTEWRKSISRTLYSNISVEYRTLHIAYCMLRGKTYEQIEPKVKPGNVPHWSGIEKIMEDFHKQPEETSNETIVCDSEKRPDEGTTSSPSGTCDSPVLPIWQRWKASIRSLAK